MKKESQDIKKLIEKGTPSSKMLALGKIFSGFLKRFKTRAEQLPGSMVAMMEKYIREDIFKYARLSPQVKLKNFLEKYQKEVGDLATALPGVSSKHFQNLLKSVSKAAPAGKPSKKEPVFEVKHGPVMSDLVKFLKMNHYKELFPQLPPKVQNDLDSVGLAPSDLKLAGVSGLRVARMFVERS